MPRKLVIMPNWIGDCALALSVALHKASAEDADLTLLVPPPLLSLCGLLSSFAIIPYKRKTHAELRATLRTIKAGNFSTIYVLPHSFSSAWFAYRTGIPKRRGVSRELREIFFNDALPRSLRTNVQHITYEYAMVLETDYNPPEYWRGMSIDKSPLAAEKIILCPGSKYGPTKKWPWFRDLVDHLPGKKVLLLGDKGENETGEAIEASAPDRVENLIGKTSLTEAAAIIAGGRLIIANDSGLMHLAGFLGTPVIGIFGSTSPTWTRPLGKKIRIAKTKCDCDPCFEKKCRYKHYKCLKDISAEYVASLAYQLLNEKLPRP
jgi:heptosyltransferase-2